MKRFHQLLPIAAILLAPSAMATAQAATAGTPTTRVAVVFSAGHETDPRDRGRPVVLVAGALGVPPEVFREAFTHVHPAPAGTEPDPQQVRENKDALLSALGRYGVTNDRLDTVSNYYRYVRRRGELWPTKPATAYATVKDGVVVGYTVTNSGSGYSSPPTISVPGIPGATALAQLTFNRAFEKNGSVSAITVVSAKAK